MNVQFMGLSEIQGSLVILDNVPNASYDEFVEIKLDDKTTRLGRIVEIYGEKIIVQVFQGTSGLSLKNTYTKLLGKPMQMPLSKEILVE